MAQNILNCGLETSSGRIVVFFLVFVYLLFDPILKHIFRQQKHINKIFS